MTGVLQVLAVLGSIALCGPASADALEGQLQAVLDDFHASYGFPGATAAIADHDGRVVSVATGLADVEAGRPMAPDGRMLAASVGKSFVGAVVLALEAEGVLMQTDLVAKHLGSRDWFARVPNHDMMTVGDLMRHAAGLPDHIYDEDFAAEMRARVMAGLDALPPETAIITKFPGLQRPAI